MADYSSHDATDTLIDQIATASGQGERLVITGHGSKQFYGQAAAGIPLETAGHCGVIDYEPGDLVLRARAGTPLTQIEALLAEQGQCLGFEPPRFAVHGAARGTLGGAVAAGLSGPRRPWVGSTRDFVLGVTMVNGLGHSLYFGGQLIKNVAGFDVPRLMAGSLGTLGLLLDVTIRVLPIRPAEVTLQLQLSGSEALQRMVEWQRRPLPLSGMVYRDNRLTIRLSGTSEGVAAAQAAIGGDTLESADEWWASLRDQQPLFFNPENNLWRISCAAAAELPEITGDWTIDWGGAQRWYQGDATAAELLEYAKRINGSLSRFRPGTIQASSEPSVFLSGISDPVAAIHQRLKKAFDPDGLFDGSRLPVAGIDHTSTVLV